MKAEYDFSQGVRGRFYQPLLNAAPREYIQLQHGKFPPCEAPTTHLRCLRPANRDNAPAVLMSAIRPA
jgi:hypothetical protein